ncbi:MAG: DEAD/DEAH box helicase [Candidatus Omnitrophota bacterium]|uniref:DEAD/DEAH box helicase n=1 Tax=Reyranella sp. TaxID=1929291 RepID=UPI00272F0FB2|nr:DEAD/DEAH box helicase [Reyranella sp.]MDP1854007.1 DEAD/DEAH box helicase [Candidatus Omnitrophota bacterium]MDP2374489.1 DEAD/DEAH box helicase [Reyranella sp.]
MSEVSFADLGLSEPLLRALHGAKYTTPTPIQARTIPALLKGRDVLGIAQTGTGKTAAFALPVLQLLAASNERAQPKSPRALVLAPTRELAVQIARSFDTYGRGLGLRLCTVVGGLGYGRQIETLARGVDILIATPGRLLDLVERGNVKLGNVTFFVLDEADRMFDMGFIRDVRRIAGSVSKNRQTLLFSATMPNDIAKLSSEILKNPERVEIAAQGRPIEKIEQRVYYVNASSKRQLLSHLLSDAALERVIVFTRTKRGANRVAEALEDRGVRSEAIHGNKSQNARQKALDNFSRGKARVLVATDLASRGIDVVGVTHVINYELPADAESYVHRIGRTARAGASGIAVSFCDSSERGQLRSIEKLTRQPIAVVSTPANEDMPVMPPVARSREERDPRDERGRDERPRGRGPGGPGRPRSFGDRPRSFGGGHGDRPHRPHGDRPHGDRPQGDRPQGDRLHADRPRPEGERQWSRGDFRDRPHQPGDRPHGDRPHGDRPQGDRPRSFGDRPHGDRPHGDRPQGDRPRSFGDRPNGPPRGDRPHGDRPHGDHPQGDRPRSNGGARRFGGGGRGRGRAA